jgi:hypothetical protein
MPVKVPAWMSALGAAVGMVILVGLSVYGWQLWEHALSAAPDWPTYTAGEGVRYCTRLGNAAQEKSMLHTVIASCLAVLGACVFIVGNLAEPAPPDARRWVRNRGALLLNLGGLFLVMSHYEFSRADAASLTAASAATAQADSARDDHASGASVTSPNAHDREAYVTCAVARATWLKSRVESSALAQSLISPYESGKATAAHGKNLNDTPPS